MWNNSFCYFCAVADVFWPFHHQRAGNVVDIRHSVCKVACWSLVAHATNAVLFTHSGDALNHTARCFKLKWVCCLSQCCVSYIWSFGEGIYFRMTCFPVFNCRSLCCDLCTLLLISFAFSALVLALTYVSIACRFLDWRCVVLREIAFLLKIC